MGDENQRTLKDFAHLFISQITPKKVEKLQTRDPPKEPIKNTNGIAFFDSGEGWFKTFILSELSILFSKWSYKIKIFEEGSLFPTVSWYLKNILYAHEIKENIKIEKLFAFTNSALNKKNELVFMEIPYFFPAKSKTFLSNTNLAVFSIPEDLPLRLRALHNLKRGLKLFKHIKYLVVLGEKPGTGKGREVFHNFVASNIEYENRLEFLGAVPKEPFIKNVSIPEGKPCLLNFSHSLTAEALASIATNLRRILEGTEAHI